MIGPHLNKVRAGARREAARRSRVLELSAETDELRRHYRAQADRLDREATSIESGIAPADARYRFWIRRTPPLGGVACFYPTDDRGAVEAELAELREIAAVSADPATYELEDTLNG